MLNVSIDGVYMMSKDSAHSYLANKFNFSPYYGRNLDALFDELTSINQKIMIVISHKEILINNLKEYGELLINTIVDACNENKNLLYKVE